MQLAVHRVQQGHVLRPLEGQLLVGVIVYHFRDAVKHGAHLVQRVLVVFGLGHDDVDTALTGPGAKEKPRQRDVCMNDGCGIPAR